MSIDAPRRTPADEVRTNTAVPPDPGPAAAYGSSAAKEERQVARQAWTVNEFCQSHRLSRTTFYKLRKAGLGPRVMVVSGRRLISAEAAAAWRQQREECAEQQTTTLSEGEAQ